MPKASRPVTQNISKVLAIFTIGSGGVESESDSDGSDFFGLAKQIGRRAEDSRRPITNNN